MAASQFSLLHALKSPQGSQLTATLLVVFLTSLLLWYFLARDRDNSPEYRVPIPIQCEPSWAGETTEKLDAKNQETISRVACLDSGKTWIDASLGEILVTVEKLQWTIKHGEKALKAERRPTNLLLAYKINEVRWEPLGVVAACVSWK
ncbi:MAG: hypothetical protein M1825_002614 [Sarcosagium campestre]|nr:MAG: hypothetical protein M1825_002614 [Sarcosagium campestre]